MDSTKSWWQSKTVWASVIGLAALVGGAFGLTLTEADQNTATEITVTVVGVVSSVIALYGRVTATKQIK